MQNKTSGYESGTLSEDKNIYFFRFLCREYNQIMMVIGNLVVFYNIIENLKLKRKQL